MKKDKNKKKVFEGKDCKIRIVRLKRRLGQPSVGIGGLSV